MKRKGKYSNKLLTLDNSCVKIFIIAKAQICVLYITKREGVKMKAKGLIALLAAIMLSVGVCVTPASAAVKPVDSVRAETIHCPNCGGTATARFPYNDYTERVNSCSNRDYSHLHDKRTTYKDTSCVCGYYHRYIYKTVIMRCYKG